MSCTGLSLFILLESKRISDTLPSSTCCVFCVRVFVFFFSAIRQQEGNGHWDLFVSRVLRGHSPPRDFYLGLLTKQVLKFSPVYFLKMWRWAWMDGWRRGGGIDGVCHRSAGERLTRRRVTKNRHKAMLKPTFSSWREYPECIGHLACLSTKQ